MQSNFTKRAISNCYIQYSTRLSLVYTSKKKTEKTKKKKSKNPGEINLEIFQSSANKKRKKRRGVNTATILHFFSPGLTDNVEIGGHIEELLQMLGQFFRVLELLPIDQTFRLYTLLLLLFLLLHSFLSLPPQSLTNA